MFLLAPSYERQMGTILPKLACQWFNNALYKKKIEIVYFHSQATVKLFIEEESLAQERD